MLACVIATRAPAMTPQASLTVCWRDDDDDHIKASRIARAVSWQCHGQREGEHVNARTRVMRTHSESRGTRRHQ
jgi:hypothetical protein